MSDGWEDRFSLSTTLRLHVCPLCKLASCPCLWLVCSSHCKRQWRSTRQGRAPDVGQEGAIQNALYIGQVLQTQ